MPMIMIIVAAAAFAAGFILRHLMTISRTSHKDLREQLQEVKTEHETYQQQVSEHFQKTSELIHEMNERSQQISLHLTQGLDSLVKPEHRLNSDKQNSDKLEHQPDETLEPPSDYPKA